MILRITTKDPLYEIRDAACNTLGKSADSTRVYIHAEAYEYFVNAFIAKHSIIRCVHFKIIDTVRTDVEHQLLRATKGNPQPYCQSKRPDWNNGTERMPDDKSISLFCHEHTAESFMAECNQRLCHRAMKETREEVLKILQEMDNSRDPYFEALAFCCVPNCVFQYGCPEGKRQCGIVDILTYPGFILDRYAEYKRLRITGGVI